MTTHHTPMVAFYTLGCRLNQYETEAIREQFVSQGFSVVPFSEPADVYVVNTCTVTAHADYRARQMLRRAIRQSPHATVVATGCYAQTNARALLDIEGVNLVLGNAEKGNLVDYVLSHIPDSPPSAHVTRRAQLDHFDERLDAQSFDGRTRAILKIQDGCDQFCSFCIIPWARGRHRSRPLDQVVAHTRDLLTAGYKEIVLTGVHMAEYGVDLKGTAKLTDGIRMLLDIPELPRLRLSSIWPTAISSEMIDLMAGASPRLCAYLHLAVQHGHDTILERMRRTYTTNEVRQLLERLIDAMPHIGLGTDIMVGFPGETEVQFDEMYHWLEEMPFSYFHVFSYSRREKTQAASLPDQVHPDIISERSAQLRHLSKVKSECFHRRFIGQQVEVLVEGRDDTGRVSGLTEHYVKVHLPGDNRLENSFVTVQVEEADAEGVQGIPVDSCPVIEQNDVRYSSIPSE